MADNDHDLDDFDLEGDLDIPEFDDSGLDGPSNDRKPVERVAGGFLQGVKSTSMDRNFQRRMIRTSLPEGYGKAFDDVDEAKRLGQDLYDTAASTLRPYEKTIKKIGRKVTEKADRFLPEGLSNKLKELTEPDNSNASGQVDYREAEITAGLAEIFGAKAEADAQEKADDVSRENIREVIGEQRHKTELDVLKTMRSGMDRLVAYQDRVTASYQRKSLELQFRQLFVARDQYTLMEAHVKENKLQLESIRKNTALPEFVKLRGNEAARQILREKAYGGALNALGDRSRDFMGNIREKAMAKVKQFTSSVGDGLQGIGDAMEMTEGSGIKLDGLEMGGQIAAGGLMEEGVARYGRRFGELLGKVPGVNRMGDRLEYFSDNKEDALRTALNRIADKDDGGLGTDYAYMTEEEQAKRREELESRTALEKARDVLDRGTGGLQAGIARMALEFLGPEGSADRRFSQGEAGNLAVEVAPYTSLTDRSITEIIPGLLTNILHEAEMIRTGDDTVERRVYDANARTFRREGAVQKDLMQTVMPDDRKKAIREDIDAIVGEVDPDGSLSEDARQAFRRQILEDLSSGRGFRVDRYTDVEKLSGRYGEPAASEISALMSKQFLDDTGGFRGGDDAAQGMRNRVSLKYRNASTTLPNYQEAVAKIYATYGPETLREMGLLQGEGLGDNSLDTKGILDNFIQDGQLTSQGMEDRTSIRGIPEEPRFDPRQAVFDTSPLPEEGRDLGRIESSLDTMQSMLSRFVEVATGKSYEEQFKNVLSAIGQLNVKEHFDISNNWLEKIYGLLVDCCGPGGGGSTPPSGGGPTPTPSDGSPTPGESMWARSKMRAMETGQSFRSKGASLLDRAQDRYDQSGVQDRLNRGLGATRDKMDEWAQSDQVQTARAKGTQVLDRLKNVASDVQTQAPGLMADVKDRATQGIAAARNVTAEDLRQGLNSTVTRVKALEMPEFDLKGQASKGYDTLAGYGQQAKAYGTDVYGRAMESDQGQRAAEFMDRMKQEGTLRLAPVKDRFSDMAGEAQQRLAPVKDMFGNLADRAKGVDVGSLRDQLMAALEQAKDTDVTELKERLSNLVDMDNYRLADQPQQWMEQGREMGRAAGDGLSQMQGNLQTRFSGEGSVKSRFDRAYGNVGGGLEGIRDRLMEPDFDLSEFFGKDAANDPRQLLAALQKASEDTLQRLEQLDVGTKVQSLTADVSSGTRSVLALLKDKIDNTKLPSYKSNVTDDSAGGPPQSSDFWSQAWDMLTNLKGHMDEKTGQLIEAMGSLGGGGAGQPGMFKRLGGKAMDGLGGVASYYGKAFSGMGSILKGGGQGVGGILKGLGGRLGGMVRGKDRGAEDPIVDIYLEGQETPVMLARDLRQGLFFDRASLEPVYRISDIEGAVVDDNENTVVTDEDVAEGRLYTLDGKKVKSGILGKLGKGYLNYATMPTRMLFTGAKKIGQYLVDKAKEPQDIYVKGEDTPRLLAVVMKNGGYLSKATQEPIMSPQDIDGAVINLEGQTLITEAELRNPGIVNARGKAIRAVGSGLGEAASKVGSLLGSYYKGVWNAGKSVVGGIGNMLGFGEGKEGGLFGGGGKKQVEWLEKIYSLLDERIAKPEKEVREGSWNQLMAEEDDASVDPNDPRSLADSKKGIGGGLLSMIAGAAGGLFDKLNPFGGDGGIGVDVDVPLGRDGREQSRSQDRKARNKAGRNPGKKGFLGKLWSGAKSVGKYVAPLAIGAGKLAATAAAGVGSVISAPVALTGAAIAAVGVGGYMLYKNFANDPEGPLHRFRLRQYGIDPESGDPVARINALEDKLEGEVNLGGGQPSLNQGVDPKELLEICGVDEEDRQAVHNWANWFQLRFKPVFLSHMAVLNSLGSGVSLADVDDDLDESLKSTYLKRVHFKEGADGPYRATSYVPFDDIDGLSGPAEVQAAYDKAMEVVAKDKAQSESGPASRSSFDPSRPGPVVVPKAQTESDTLNAGIERRKKESPTAQDIGPMDKETYARLSAFPEGRKILERRRQQRNKVPDKVVKVGNTTITTSVEEAKLTDAQIIDKYMDENPDAGSFPTTDARERQKARMSEYRKGRAAGAAGDADMQDDGISEARRQKRAWASASAAAAGDGDDNDKRMEERRRRDERVSVQTETQTQKNSAALNSAVNRMVSILSDSHEVQRNIDANLSEMNKMLKSKYEKDLAAKDQAPEPTLNAQRVSQMFGDNKEKPRKSAPWMTSR